MSVYAHFSFRLSAEREDIMKFMFLKKIWYRINPKYKDSLFCMVFGSERYKKYALDLYNAINHSNYSSESDLEIITLSDAVYIKMKNDVAYLVSGTIALYEHQSTVNKNMPLRGFLYFGELYSQLLKGQKARIFNRTLVKIPTPQYIVFYNGTDDSPEVDKLKLSDAFINPRNDNEFEFTATVININPGKNTELLDSCKPLKDYSTFVGKVRENEKTMSLEEAVDKAVTECIDKNILRDILSRERAAVMLDILTTFDEKEYADGLREEGRAEEQVNTERERKRADDAEAKLSDTETKLCDAEAKLSLTTAELARYKEKYGDLE